MRPHRIYVDASVIGGCLDPEFSKWSNALLERARREKLVLLMSEIVMRELASAPPEVLGVLDGLPWSNLEHAPFTAEAAALAEAYVEEQVLGRRSPNDAAHVAAASTARADAIASWNFEQIVQLERIKGYQRVNLLRGYGMVTILSPRDLAETDARETPTDQGFDSRAHLDRVRVGIFAEIEQLTPALRIRYFRKAAETGPCADWWKTLREESARRHGEKNLG
ncbi:MAG: hypothetical protein IPJ19_19170 [Planctomycetes bacterium]|nr:hypothetical protein [Planctomycetota bacterium]